MSSRCASSSPVIEIDDRLPPTVEPEKVEVPEPELLATILGPGLVAVLRQQLAAVQHERLTGRSQIVGR